MRLEFMYWTAWRWVMPPDFLDDVRVGANAAWRKSMQRKGDDKRLITRSRRRWLGESLILGMHRKNDWLFPPVAGLQGSEHDWFYKWADAPEGVVYSAMGDLQTISPNERIEITTVLPFIRGSVGPAFVASLTDYVPRNPDYLKTWLLRS